MKDLTTGEKECLRRLVEIQNIIISLSIEEISAEVHYSPATINRVIKKLGYKNIKEYKQKNYLMNQKVSYSSTRDESVYYQKLHQLIDTNFDHQFDQVMMWLKDYDKVHIVGIEASATLAITLNHGFMYIGYTTDCYLHRGLFEAYVSNGAKDGDIVIVCSYSCQDVYLSDCISQLHSLPIDIKVILITGNPHNPIASKFDLIISCDIIEYDSMFRFSSPITIIGHKLITYLIKHDNEEH